MRAMQGSTTDSHAILALATLHIVMTSSPPSPFSTESSFPFFKHSKDRMHFKIWGNVSYKYKNSQLFKEYRQVRCKSGYK